MRWDLVHALALVQLASAGPVRTRDTVTAQVNFNNNTGTPQHLASGLLYGVPDTLNQIPVGYYHSSTRLLILKLTSITFSVPLLSEYWV
jgi:hypothetical protein